jgi:hypothetical protein
MDISQIQVKKRHWKNLKLLKGGKPYIKKLKSFSGFSVWLVNGEYIRTNICEDFVEYDSNDHLSFIPKDEIWIEKDNIHNEHHFFIKRITNQRDLIKRGYTPKQASDRSLLMEMAERHKHSAFKKINSLPSTEKIKKVHKKIWFKKDDLEVWIVNGRKVRDLFYVDYADGGHGFVYNFVPLNEVWIDDDILSPKERKLILIHELHERKFMAKKNYAYHHAHRLATKIEDKCRKGLRDVNETLTREILSNKQTK